MTTPEPAPDLSNVPTDNGVLANQIETWAEFRSRWDTPPTRRWIEDLAEHLGSTIIGPLAVALEHATTPSQADADALRSDQDTRRVALVRVLGLPENTGYYPAVQAAEDARRERDALAAEVEQLHTSLRSMAEDLSEAEGLGRALPDRPLDTVWASLLGEVRSSRAEVERLRGDLAVAQASDRDNAATAEQITEWGVHIVNHVDRLDYVQPCYDEAATHRMASIFDPAEATATLVVRSVTRGPWLPAPTEGGQG